MPVHVRGQLAVLTSAIGFGVGTALSVVALRTLRPADLLAVELGGSALVAAVLALGLAGTVLVSLGSGSVPARGAQVRHHRCQHLGEPGAYLRVVHEPVGPDGLRVRIHEVPPPRGCAARPSLAAGAGELR